MFERAADPRPRRKIEGNERLHEVFAEPFDKALKIRWQNHNQRGRQPYSWYAPETECIGKGKTHKPYEFGVKVSVTTTNRRGNVAMDHTSQNG